MAKPQPAMAGQQTPATGGDNFATRHLFKNRHKSEQRDGRPFMGFPSQFYALIRGDNFTSPISRAQMYVKLWQTLQHC